MPPPDLTRRGRLNAFDEPTPFPSPCGAEVVGRLNVLSLSAYRLILSVFRNLVRGRLQRPPRFRASTVRGMFDFSLAFYSNIGIEALLCLSPIPAWREPR